MTSLLRLHFARLHRRRKAPYANLVYIYIYVLDSHMAPHGAVEVEQSEARSSEVIRNTISNVIANVICNVKCNAKVTCNANVTCNAM
jgi:hypothetical protein